MSDDRTPRVIGAVTAFIIGTAISLFSLVFSWAVFFGGRWEFQTNLFFLPPSLSAAIGRALLYLFAVLAWWITWLVWSSFLKRIRRNETDRTAAGQRH